MIRAFLSLFLLVGLLNPVLAAKFPKPTGWVSDYAGVIDSDSHQKMSRIIQEVEQKTSAEIAVVTLKKLENQTIEGLAVELFEKWEIGKKGKDNGILIITAIEDKKIWIEVGYGLEGILPDGLCGEILDKYIVPAFQKGSFGEGLSMGTLAIASIIARDAGVELTGSIAPSTTRRVRKPSALGLIFKLLIFIGMAFIFIRHPSLFLFFLMMGGFRGGGFGGGGFSGGFGGFGGGMSGGGGAGRSW